MHQLLLSHPMAKHILVVISICLIMGKVEIVFGAIGANWGTQATHPLSPKIVAQMLRDNGIQKVKLFDADGEIFEALGKTGIEVTVGIPNELLTALANDVSAAENWVAKNISKYVSSGNVNIKYVAVGNEPFLTTFNGTYLTTTLPALQNIQSALIKAGLGNKIKVTCPLNADVIQSASNLPSGGDFRTDIHDLMLKIVKFFSDNGSPFTVNIYPFISLYNDPSFPIEFAFFDGNSTPLNDGGKIYTNVFDASHDMLLVALQKNGFGNIPIVVGEIGWPSDGNLNANPTNAKRFNQGFINHVAKGTPLRPNVLVDAYLFSLIDEDNKSVQPGNFERHWGIFYFDGMPKYVLNLGTSNTGLVAAKGVKYLPKKWCIMNPAASPDDAQVGPSVTYACSNADCTSLGYGASCGNLDAKGNASYAYNSYFQQNNQLDSACKFPDNLSVITSADPSTQTCRFAIMIESTSKGSTSSSVFCKPVLSLVLFVFTVPAILL